MLDPPLQQPTPVKNDPTRASRLMAFLRILKSTIRRLRRQTHGQDLIEYAMLAALISLAAYGAAAQLGGSLNSWYAVFSDDIAEKEKKSHCGASGMAHSQGKCHGG